MNIISKLRLRNVEKNFRDSAEAQRAECDDGRIFNALVAAFAGGDPERRQLETLASIYSSHRLPAVAAAVTAPIQEAKIEAAIAGMLTEIPDSEVERLLAEAGGEPLKLEISEGENN